MFRCKTWDWTLFVEESSIRPELSLLKLIHLDDVYKKICCSNLPNNIIYYVDTLINLK